MRLRHVAVIGIVVGLSASALAQTPRRDGQWEVLVEMQVPGMPMKMPPITTKQCLTPDDVADPQKSIPSDPKSKCTMSDFKMDGNKVTWNVKCETPPGTGTGEIVYRADAYDGSMNMKTEMGGQMMVMTTKYTGKRLGDCVK